MSIALVVLMNLAQIQLPPSARRDDVVVYEASGLVAPCREEAEAYFVGQGHTTYQWAASTRAAATSCMWRAGCALATTMYRFTADSRAAGASPTWSWRSIGLEA